MSPLDYWCWSIALEKLKRVPQTNNDDQKQTAKNVESFAQSLESKDVQRAVHHLLKQTVESFKESLESEDMKKAVHHIRCRAL